MNGPLRLVLCVGLTASCGTRAELLEPTVRSCPPAPFRDAGARCDFEGSCRYEGPRNIGPGRYEVAGTTCRCEGGAIACTDDGPPCSGCTDPPLCPLVTAPGILCTVEGPADERPGNAECLLPVSVGGATDVPMACSCDGPGPSWRCVSLRAAKR